MKKLFDDDINSMEMNDMDEEGGCGDEEQAESPAGTDQAKAKRSTPLKDWAREIVKQYENSIPVYPRNLKGGEKSRFGTTCLGGYKRMVEIIRDSNTGRFATMSEVERAAFHIGISILFQAEIDHTKHRAFYILMKQQERLISTSTLIDDAINHFERLYTAFNNGVISPVVLDKAEGQIIDAVPGSIKDVIKKRILEIKSGKRVERLTESWGGTR